MPKSQQGNLDHVEAICKVKVKVRKLNQSPLVSSSSSRKEDSRGSNPNRKACILLHELGEPDEEVLLKLNVICDM